MRKSCFNFLSTNDYSKRNSADVDTVVEEEPNQYTNPAVDAQWTHRANKKTQILFGEFCCFAVAKLSVTDPIANKQWESQWIHSRVLACT